MFRGLVRELICVCEEVRERQWLLGDVFRKSLHSISAENINLGIFSL